MDTGEMTAKGVPNRRKQAKMSTRQGVIEAGRAIFMEGGYERAVIRDIAKRIQIPDKPNGMSTGAVFAHFTCKADLLLTIVKEELVLQDELLEKAVPEVGTALDRVVRIFTADYVFFRERLHVMEALARLETHVEPKAVNPHAIAERARSLTLSRRMRVFRPIHDCLWNAPGPRLLLEPHGAQARLLVSSHLHACREAATHGQEAHEYQSGLAKDLALAFFREDLSLGV